MALYEGGLGWVGVKMGRVEVGVEWIGSGMGIEWIGVGIGCCSCGLDWVESCVLFPPHVLSIVSVSSIGSGYGVVVSFPISFVVSCVVPHCVVPRIVIVGCWLSSRSPRWWGSLSVIAC